MSNIDKVIEATREAIEQARKEEREKVAQWMMERAYSTGHGDTIEDLLKELQWQLDERWKGAIAFTMREEREACAHRAGVALLGADHELAKRVDRAIQKKEKK